MGPEHVWWSGMWIFPVVMPAVMLIVILVVVCLVFGRSHPRTPWYNPCGFRPERENPLGDPLSILKSRYVKGELTREQFEQMKTDIA